MTWSICWFTKVFLQISYKIPVKPTIFRQRSRKMRFYLIFVNRIFTPLRSQNGKDDKTRPSGSAGHRVVRTLRLCRRSERFRRPDRRETEPPSPGSGSISAEGKRPGRQLPETVVPNRAPSNPRPANKRPDTTSGTASRVRFLRKKRQNGRPVRQVPTSTRQNGRPRVGYEVRRRTVRRANGPISRSGSFVAEEGAHAGFRKRKLTYKT